MIVFYFICDIVMTILTIRFLMECPCDSYSNFFKGGDKDSHDCIPFTIFLFGYAVMKMKQSFHLIF